LSEQVLTSFMSYL